jgi:hypothetical protein
MDHQRRACEVSHLQTWCQDRTSVAIGIGGRRGQSPPDDHPPRAHDGVCCLLDQSGRRLLTRAFLPSFSFGSQLAFSCTWSPPWEVIRLAHQFLMGLKRCFCLCSRLAGRPCRNGFLKIPSAPGQMVEGTHNRLCFARRVGCPFDRRVLEDRRGRLKQVV